MFGDASALAKQFKVRVWLTERRRLIATQSLLKAFPQMPLLDKMRESIHHQFRYDRWDSNWDRVVLPLLDGNARAKAE
jgi:hypothetical protein